MKICKILLLICLSVMTVAFSNVSAADDGLLNVAQGKSIEVTTGTVGYGTAETMVDGNTGALIDILWDGTNTGVGFIIDLGKSYAVEEIKLYALAGNGSGRDQVWIDYSTDKSDWTNVVARNNDVNDGFSSSQMSESVLTVNNFGTAICRYIRLTSWTYAVWCEIEVYAAMPKAESVALAGRNITVNFSTDIEPTTVTADTLKLYATDVLAEGEDYTLSVEDYTLSVEGKTAVFTLKKDWYDTEFKIEVSDGIKSTILDNLSGAAVFTVTAPPAIEISKFELTKEAETAKIDVIIKNNTTDVTTTSVVFAMLLDENNVVTDRVMQSDTIAPGREIPVNLSIPEVPGNCRVKAFVWRNLSDMQVWTQSKILN